MVLFDQRQHLVLVEWRRRGQGPFELGGPWSPRVVPGQLLARERPCHSDQEYEDAHSRDIRTDRRYEVPAGKGVGIVDVTARHTRQPEKVLWEKDQIDADERHPEVQLAEPLFISVAGDFREPIVPAGKDRED